MLFSLGQYDLIQVRGLLCVGLGMNDSMRVAYVLGEEALKLYDAVKDDKTHHNARHITTHTEKRSHCGQAMKYKKRYKDKEV